MSIEKDLQDLTAAVKALAAAISGTKAAVAANPAGEAGKASKPPKADAPAPEPTKVEGPKALTYADVRKPFLALYAKDQDAAIGALQSVVPGVTKLLDLADDGKGEAKQFKPEYAPKAAAIIKALEAKASEAA